MVLAPVPERERRVAVELEAERALAEDARGVERVGLEQEDENAASVAPREAERERGAPSAPASRPGRRARAAPAAARANFVHAGERDRSAARPGGRGEPEAPDQEARA